MKSLLKSQAFDWIEVPDTGDGQAHATRFQSKRHLSSNHDDESLRERLVWWVSDL